ncbi:MAG: DNA-deoxyinosine glycosylase [Methylovulum sp.]|nr:DNA-deoxyinosine glycosylase [Methylovulum sp.]
MMDELSGNDGFAPIVSEQAKVLILGTMPGTTSLLKQQYYGHPRNAFWPIMTALFGIGAGLDYPLRAEMLSNNGIAVWDVIQHCRRLGSLDANIDIASVKVNDFGVFFIRYPLITQVFFNGAAAEKMYRTHLQPALQDRFPYLQYRRLPSTSPAHASLSLEQKIESWRVIKASMVD